MLRAWIFCLLVGCGAGTGVAYHSAIVGASSCDFSKLGGAYNYCSDYVGPDVSPYMQSCLSAGAQWSVTGCQGNYVGGCRVVSTNPMLTQTNWFAPETGYTAGSLMQSCPASSSTYVAP
jgi:hypothetical protein